MLTDIENQLVAILRERITDIPEENILLAPEPAKLPALLLSTPGFEFESLGLVEHVDEGRVEFEERFNGDGRQIAYALKEKPFHASVQVESPPGTSLVEKTDFLVNYEDASIGFHEAPPKGENNIWVTYLSQKGAMMVKGLRVKATYYIDVLDTDRGRVDSLAEKVVRILLMAGDELVTEGVELRPVGGETLPRREGETTGGIRLKYVCERELRVKKLVPPIEQIEITSKNL